jgi:anti-sigma regulatory factor (Ser/Thr protein kinase)
VVVSARKIERLRDALGADDSDGVSFADMATVGSNPARIIPAWRQFVDESGGRALRGIGEPIWSDRSPAELIECQRHESLLNLAFADATDFTLLCPYDTASLAADVIDEAQRSHPHLLDGDYHSDSPCCRTLEAVSAPFDTPLPAPPADAREVPVLAGTLDLVREFVAELAMLAGLDARRCEELVLAVHELATNSIRHAGGDGVVRGWIEHDFVVCEVQDRGLIGEPLAGRVKPQLDQSGGFGLWLVNQLCDLVQIRAFGTGGVVRAHVRR